MAIQKTEAVLLRKRDLRETSLALTFFTRDFGKVQGVLKGARGTRARADINPLYFSIDQIVFYENRKKDFFIISQCEPQQIFLNILKDWERAGVAYYLLELVDVFTEPGVKLEELFICLNGCLSALDAKKEPLSIARFFEVRFLMSLGLWPGCRRYEGVITKGAMSTLNRFETIDIKSALKIKVDTSIGEEIRKITGKILLENLDRPLKTTSMFSFLQ